VKLDVSSSMTETKKDLRACLRCAWRGILAHCVLRRDGDGPVDLVACPRCRSARLVVVEEST
jgi:hypothetical protein